MNDPIAMLKQQHREATEMLRTLAESKPGSRRNRTIEQLVNALTMHLDFEERELYPLVSQRVGEEEAQEARVEHELARTGLAKLQELADAPGFGAAVAMLTAGIRHHVREEETEIFPELKRKVDREQLRALGDTLAAMVKPQRSTARRQPAA